MLSYFFIDPVRYALCALSSLSNVAYFLVRFIAINRRRVSLQPAWTLRLGATQIDVTSSVPFRNCVAAPQQHFARAGRETDTAL